VNFTIVLGHELGHALTTQVCRGETLAELCARQHENAVRQDLHLKGRRPLPVIVP
jgi:hypothetical protein